MNPKTDGEKRLRRESKRLLVLLVVLTLLPGGRIGRALGASSDVDLSFDPGAGVNSTVRAIVTLSGDKTLIAGDFTLVHDAPLSHVAWLNADGSPDTTLRAAIANDGHSHWQVGVYSVAAQPDGKILLGGSFATTNGTRNIVRLNADGSLDNSFSAGALAATGDVVDCLALQSDGKVVLGGRHSSGNGLVVRLNADGSLDAAFAGATVGGAPLQNAARYLVQQADARILVGGEFRTVNGVACTNLVRLNADGSLDSSFSAPAATAPVYALVLVADGKMVIGRADDAVRLNADGSLDPAFTAYRSWYRVVALARQSDGKILCGVSYGTSIARLNANGTPDATFSTTLGVASGEALSVRTFGICGDGRIVVGGWFSTVNGAPRQAIARLHANGSLDSSFLNGPAGVVGDVTSLALQNDGKVLIGGRFQQIGAASRNRIARLNPDGSLDNFFLDGQSGVSLEVKCIALQSDGRILIGGDFDSVNGVARGRIARLNADGSLDGSFLGTQSGPNSGVTSIAVQPDGKILIAGWFTRFNLTQATNIARLNADGSLDSSFLATLTRGGSGAPHLLLQPDGKILVAGDFIAVNWMARINLARLNPDGSLDNPFAAGNWPGGLGAVNAIALQTDGRILVGGTVPGGEMVPYVARFSADGTLDGSFALNLDGPVRAIDALALQSDGKVLVGGWPGGIVGVARTNLARLNADGSWDDSFVCAQSLPANGIGCIVRQPDGKFLIGGSFGVINQVVHPNVARLMGENSPLEILTPPQSQTAEVGTRVDFKVAAVGTPTLTYAWFLNGTNPAGCGPDPWLRLADVQPEHGGAYTVVISNACGAVTSAPAMLSVVVPVERRSVLGIKLMGEAGSLLNVDYADALSATPTWLALDMVSLAGTSQYCFDLTMPLPAQRFYRAWQAGTPGVMASLELQPVPAITLIGGLGNSVRVDCINRFGPIDAWVTLDTVVLTNTSQLYLDTAAPGQPERLYRLVPVP